MLGIRENVICFAVFWLSVFLIAVAYGAGLGFEQEKEALATDLRHTPDLKLYIHISIYTTFERCQPIEQTTCCVLRTSTRIYNTVVFISCMPWNLLCCALLYSPVHYFFICIFQPGGSTDINTLKSAWAYLYVLKSYRNRAATVSTRPGSNHTRMFALWRHISISVWSKLKGQNQIFSMLKVCKLPILEVSYPSVIQMSQWIFSLSKLSVFSLGRDV